MILMSVWHREICEIHTKEFGLVLLVAVGATMVGSIVITAPDGTQVKHILFALFLFCHVRSYCFYCRFSLNFCFLRLIRDMSTDILLLVDPPFYCCSKQEL